MYSLWITCSSSNYSIVNSVTGEYIQSYRTLKNCLTVGLGSVRAGNYQGTIKQSKPNCIYSYDIDPNNYYYNNDRTKIYSAYSNDLLVATKVLEVATIEDLEMSSLVKTHPELFI
jgi:hypothetical protein